MPRPAGIHCTHLFPILRSAISCWQLEIGNVAIFTPWKLANTANQGFLSPQRADCKTFTSTRCCQHSSYLSPGMLASPNPYISAQILSLQRDLFIQSYPSLLSLSIISSTLSFRALISVCNYLVHVFYVLACCSASSLKILSCLVLFTATFLASSTGPDSCF